MNSLLCSLIFKRHPANACSKRLFPDWFFNVVHGSSNVAPYREHVIYLDLPFSSLFLVVEVNEVVMKNKLCGMRRVLLDGDFGSFNDDLSF